MMFGVTKEPSHLITTSNRVLILSAVRVSLYRSLVLSPQECRGRWEQVLRLLFSSLLVGSVLYVFASLVHTWSRLCVFLSSH